MTENDTTEFEPTVKMVVVGRFKSEAVLPCLELDPRTELTPSKLVVSDLDTTVQPVHR